MKGELADVVNTYEQRQKSRWFGDGISACIAEVEPDAKPSAHSINWNRVLGLGTALVVVALSWTVLGIAVSRFVR